MAGIHIGTVVGNTSPSEYQFVLKTYSAKMGDMVSVDMQVPAGDYGQTREVTVWGRIVELSRFNPFLPTEAGQELAEDTVKILDTILSQTRDQVQGTVLVLGYTEGSNITNMKPLSYPVDPGKDVLLPPTALVQKVLTGDEKVHRIHLGTLIGRKDVEVKIKTNAIVARHMAILAMTGGGKTVAARQIITELMKVGYPVVIFDPHGDYLGLYEHRKKFGDCNVKLFFPSITVKEENRDLIAYLIAQMTQGLSEPQKDAYQEAIEAIDTPEAGLEITDFIDKVLVRLGKMQESPGGKGSTRRHPGTIPAVKRGLRIVKAYVSSMHSSNQRLREHKKLAELPFEPMPDPVTQPHEFVQPKQVSIIYLGGYDHVTQSTMVAIILKNLFEKRASMRNEIPPLFCVVEEAHNFIPSRGEGQAETPSVEIIRKVITEGRKFGVGLLLISQRPNRLDETTLSQCNTFMILRLVNPNDQRFVERVMENLTKADSRLLPAFGHGQGIISGQAVRFPLVIQVGFDKELISTSIGDENFVEAVQDWSKSAEGKAAEISNKFVDELKK